MVHHMSFGEILHGPAEVRGIDTEHGGTLADGRRQEKHALIGPFPLEAIHQISSVPTAQSVPAGAALTVRMMYSVDPTRSALFTTSS